MDYPAYLRKIGILNSPKAKEMYRQYLEIKEASTDMNSTTTSTANWAIFDSQPISFAPSYPQACTVPCDMEVSYNHSPKKKKEKTMYVENDKHIEASKINYLTDRANSVYYRKSDELLSKFGLIDDSTPQSAEEFVKRIQDGKFMFKDETVKAKKNYYYKAHEGIRWRDPAMVEDNAGFDAAGKSLKAAYQDAKDMIAIGTPAEGLAAVKTLEAWTPTVGKS